MSRSQSVIVFHVHLLVGALVSSLAAAAASSSQLRSRSRSELGSAIQARTRSDVGLVQAGQPSESENLKYLLRTLDKFRAFAKQSESAVEERHAAEADRLQASMTQTADQGTLLALNQSVTSNTESLLETRRVYNNMVNFASSMETFLDTATSKGFGCEQTKCGQHAFCTETTLGAQCICNEGFVGTGQDCAAPTEFMPHHLLYEGPGNTQTQATSMHVSLFGKNNIAVAFVDTSRNNMGRIVVGNVKEAGMAILSPPEAFTVAAGQAFDPVIVGTEGKRVLVAWRDQSVDGLGWLRAGAMGVTGIRGADQHMTWGEPVNLCRSQSHKMGLVSLPGNRVVALYADKVKSTPNLPAESFGNSVLLGLGSRGAVTKLGQFRFSDYPVCRLEVTKLSPTSFIVAARAGKAVDEMDSSITENQEAMALYGEMSGDDLVFDPNPVNLEPKGTHIWARGVSLIAPNTFAYAYQRGQSKKIMMAVVTVDPKTHKMQVVHSPSQVKEGVSPYVSMLSVPYTASDPHTLIYYDNKGQSMVNICRWDSHKNKLDRCEDFEWLQGKVKSASGVHLGGGKSFMVFAAENGVPYYGVFGVSKK